MDTFLDDSVFPGSFVARSELSNSFVSQASFNGCIAVSNWPRREAASLLPPELELGANSAATPDVHPVVFVFGDQTHGAMMFGGFTYSLGVNYQELGICIPFVKHRDGTLLQTYMVRMYSSYTIATWNGNLHYGFSKEMARLRWQGPLYVVTTEDDRLLLHAAVDAAGPWSAGRGCALPNFRALQALFALPVIGRKPTGVYACSYFGWDFDDALVRPADVSVSIEAGVLGDLPTRQCSDVAAGSFEVRGMMWRLSWPTSCRFR